ncbi:MAG: RagB/SusD family nutrient uptake outer membrane protein [Gemmatimonadota bacterium]
MTFLPFLRRAAAPLVLLGVAASFSACDLEKENPNAPTEEEVLTELQGILALAVGIQAQFAGAVEDFIAPPALVTDEWGTRTRALLSYRSLVTGQSIEPSFDVVEQPFVETYEIVRSANNLIERAPQVGLGAGLETGIVALAKLLKAMSLGMSILQYDQVPLDVSGDAPLPAPRAVVLDTVLGLLESARADVAATSAADLAEFRSRVLGRDFDLPNTIEAMLARYYLTAGRYAEAVVAADRVNLGVLSRLTYTDTNQNPIYNLSTQLIYVAALASFAAEADSGDARVEFWVDTSAEPFVGNPDSLLLPFNQYAEPTDPYPVYLPDEIKLIKAEALARLGQLEAAAALVNEVRTQASSALDEPVAGLPPLEAGQLDTLEELLAAIAYERRYELYMQGLRWEDTRRLGEAVTVTPTIAFLPYPDLECTANPAVPC